MKRYFLLILSFFFFVFAESQLRYGDVDGMKTSAVNAQDTSKSLLYAEIAFNYAFWQIDSGIQYAQKAISLAKKIQFKKGEAAGLASYGWSMWAAGDYDKAVDASLKSLNLYKDLKDYVKMADVYGELTVFYRDAEDFTQAFKYAMLSKELYDSLIVTHVMNNTLPVLQLGSVYLFHHQLDSASYYISRAYENEKEHGRESGYVYNLMGYVEAGKKNYPAALGYYRSAIATGLTQNNVFDIVNTYTFLAQMYQETGKMDSSIWYAKEVLHKSGYSSFRHGTLDVLGILAQDYKLSHQNDSALKYLELRISMNDILFNKEKSRNIQALSFNETLHQQELEATRKQYENQVKLYMVFGLAGLFLLIGIIQYRNNKVKQKANVLLKSQKIELENTLKTLETTQAQLVHSEKMASLGELTAGIAHEIQNPLNFVNNFSDVNRELIDEMEQEIDSGNMSEAKSIAKNIQENEEKINQHGKRADAIVKAMLQHSRSGSGVKESSGINTLVDEYLRLSYQGLRAKDKSFNAILKTDYDQAVGSIIIIPQDIGRVFLNLYNNAFYAVSEKKKLLSNNYEPVVSVSTKKLTGEVEIRVKDNGNGIPPKLMGKIFQPFFTTKPAGQGTGLGLSLSYDIIKAHGGEIKVKTEEGVFTEFVIQLPLV
ncbi:MAG TPA: ATP-binding protein [Puia sp.]|jgi:two-component system NtrC family sensor kinase|nr:ATP-binding protein [Puia sp.]